jgi:beta-lysine 5,6-aminomutase alpha subunit
VAFLEKIERSGLMPAIEEGLFADIKRPRDMGKGLEGLRKKADGYWNPFETHLHRELGL